MKRSKAALHIENEGWWSIKKYAKLHPDEPFAIYHTPCAASYILYRYALSWIRPKELTVFHGTFRSKNNNEYGIYVIQ